MTRVIIYSYKSMPVGFRFEGHSGYDVEGKDIVCAAISALAITAVNALESVAKVEPITIADEAKAVIQTIIPLNISPEKRHDCEVILMAFKQGLLDIKQNYPNQLMLLTQ